MKLLTPARTRWLLVVVFAVGMAWVEAASVYYLRVIVDRVNPYQLNPLPMRGTLDQVEAVREAATLVMLLTIGALTGRSWYPRLGYASIAFGVWDIFYYVFLKLISGWPASIFDWDVLFLLPLPWWGPVIAPISIAILMIVWGTLITRDSFEDLSGILKSNAYRLGLLGIALALYVFMADSLRAVSEGLDATKAVLPQTFNWMMFAVALTLMAAPVLQIVWRARSLR